MIDWMALPAEIQARMFCEIGRLFFCGLLTCKRLQQCILRHASRLPASTRKLALKRFQAAYRSGGFKMLNEAVTCDLVGSDDLTAGEEEAVLVAVVKWIKAEGGEEWRRGKRLLGRGRSDSGC